jgi:hypothetical protein
VLICVQQSDRQWLPGHNLHRCRVSALLAGSIRCCLAPVSELERVPQCGHVSICSNRYFRMSGLLRRL